MPRNLCDVYVPAGLKGLSRVEDNRETFSFTDKSKTSILFVVVHINRELTGVQKQIAFSIDFVKNYTFSINCYMNMFPKHGKQSIVSNMMKQF